MTTSELSVDAHDMPSSSLSLHPGAALRDERQEAHDASV